MRKLTVILCLTLAVLLGSASSNSSSAQAVHHVVGVGDLFADIKIKIVDLFEDEKWKVVGACSNVPTLKVKIVDLFEDQKIKIVDLFEDKRVCISGANTLDRKTLKLLGLVD